MLNIGFGNQKRVYVYGSDGEQQNNLLNNYMVMVVKLLLDCDLLKILAELTGIEDDEFS